MTSVIDTFKDAIDSGLAKSRREELRLSQSELAQRLGISPSAINRWEAGSRVPREDIAQEYLEALGIELQGQGKGKGKGQRKPEPESGREAQEPAVDSTDGSDGGADDSDGGGGCPEGQHRMPDGGCMDDEDMGAGGRYGIRGVATLEGSWTGDGRQFKKDGLDWPDPAEVDIPFQWQKETSHGGDNDVTVNIGRLTSLARQGDEIIYDGFIDLGSEDGAEYVRRRETAGVRGGVSIVADDPGNGEMEIVFDGDEPVGVIFHSGRIRALTAVDVAAFAEAYVELTGPLTASAQEAEASAAELARLDGETAVVAPDDGLDGMRALIAAATSITIDDAPPKAWFEEPQELPKAGAITVTAEGRFYGLLAPKHVAHRSFKDHRVEVPTGNVDYSRWMNRQTLTAEGEVIHTGPITMQCGHASTSPQFRADPNAAMQHYDNSCSIVATARIGENAHGVWIAGALLPDVDRGSVARVMACQLSGDWQAHRESPGMREFVAALLVPVPGFPVGDSDPSLRMDEGLLVSSASPVSWLTASASDRPSLAPAPSSWMAAGGVPGDEQEADDTEEDVVTGENENEAAEGDEAGAEKPEDQVTGTVDDLPSPEEVEQAKADRELRAAKIAEMKAELGLDKNDDSKKEGE